MSMEGWMADEFGVNPCCVQAVFRNLGMWLNCGRDQMVGAWMDGMWRIVSALRGLESFVVWHSTPAWD